MKIALTQFFLLLFFVYSAFSQTESVRVAVEDVHDGDTITVSDASDNIFKIRLIGIDAPELAQDFGNKAQTELKKLLKRDKKNIIVKPFGLDRNNRILAQVFVGDLDVNLELLKMGFAWFYDSHPLGKERLKIYLEAMNEAKENKLGLWKNEDATDPKDWRKKND